MGLVDEILKHLVEEAASISQAPLAFIELALRCRRGGHKNERIASLEERVKLRDDQLNNKVQSTFR